MSENFPNIGRYVSILDRLMKMYYDRGLADYEIGWGQQFYVEYIYDNPGSSAQKMVEQIRVDKATLTKVIKKLNAIGYVSCITDENDKRIKRLYLTDKAIPAAKRIKEIHRSFYKDIFSGITSSDSAFIEQRMKEMTDNINKKVWHRMEG